MSNTTRTKDARPQTTEVRPQITAVGLSALILGFLVALVATWAISGRAAASDDGLVDVDAAVGVHAGLPAADGTMPVSCAPVGDGTGTGDGDGDGDGTGNGDGDGTGDGDGDGTGDGDGDGTGDGDGDGTGTTGYFIDILAIIGVDGTDGAVSGGLFPGISSPTNLLDVSADTGSRGILDHDGADSVVIGGQPAGSPALIDVDGGLLADLGN